MTEFSELGLSAATLKAVAETGYTTATPIQAEAIPVALQGRDVLGIAQTGTGKTAAFTLPMIDKLAAGRAKARMPRALVLAPTRELADQVSASFEKYAKGQKLSWALLIGGVSFSDQEMKLDRGVDVLIATPGRLLDHFQRGKLLMTGVQLLVVDEADRMLDMGFIPDIERIFQMTPPKKQTLFFSATMPPEITRITKQFLKDPVRIEATRPATTGENITQYVARLPTADHKAKRTALRALIERSEINNGIVFCNRKSEVDIVAKSLKTHGFDAAPIHGDLDQSTRTRTLESFRAGDLKLLVASDVAARGLDIPAVSHVFNYDVPHQADDYVHRIGRTGRAGRSGEAFMLVTPADAKNIDKVIKLIGKTPEDVVLDLDWANLKDEPRRDRGGRDRNGARGGSGGGSSRDRDRDRRPREVKEHGQRASMEPFQPTGDVVGDEVSRPARRARRPDAPVAEATTPQAPVAEAPAPAEAAPSSRRAPRREAERSEHREPERAREPRREARGERPERAPRPAPQDRPTSDQGRDRGADRDRSRDRGPERSPERGQERGRDRDRDRGRDRDDGDRVVGFGSDVPAFLTRAPPPRTED
jgi:superfamily II DNA/RNA helicase